ncbi:MAG: hypothetical protein R3300_07345 [Candidatus Promineifilaceae bacterium]|nr:hypothetical protein [Candidatus Promineifilaceae bacterium]
MNSAIRKQAKALRPWLLLVAALLVLSGLIVGEIQAKGKTTAERITIAGPNLEQTIVVEELVRLQKLSLMSLEDFEQTVQPPADIGPGWTVIRYYREGGYVQETAHPDAVLEAAEEVVFQRTQGFRPIDKVRYHADPDGGPGYIYYIQLNLNIIVPYEGNWYRATAEGDAIMREVLAEHDVTLTGGQSAEQPSDAALRIELVVVVSLALVLGLLLLLTTVGKFSWPGAQPWKER